LKLSLMVLAGLLQIVIVAGTISGASAADEITTIPTDEHHVVELNSNQPYVAGFHVNTRDLCTREVVDAVAITACIESAEGDAFPEDAWLGGGMFVQAQDSRFLHIDYGFYMMLVKDASGRLFVDLGLIQTREFSAPIQAPPDELVYAYTWQLLASDSPTSVTLSASWDPEGTVHYSISTGQSNTALASINVPSLPNCENIIKKFYAGNTVVNHFPFSRYVNYFQFGVISSRILPDTQWTVSLRNPRILRTGRFMVDKTSTQRGEKGWVTVDEAWTVQGDSSYLDSDWMWGGKPYYGVDAHATYDPGEGLAEVLFSYTGSTVDPGTALWLRENGNPPLLGPPEAPQLSLGIFVASEVCLSLCLLLVYAKLRERGRSGEAADLLSGNN